MPEIASYGTWTSPISAADAAAAGGGVQWVDTVGGVLWWAEARPGEGGRVALVRAGEEVLPAPWNARNRVHEYGGRPWLAIGGRLVFTHWDDQRVYVRDLTSGKVTPITAEPAVPHGVRFGDLRPGPRGTVWAVRETSVGSRRADVSRDLVELSLGGAAPRSLAASHHFLTAPQLSPDGAHAAWLGWDHPAMPWDGTELCVAPLLEDGSLGTPEVIAGGAAVAVCQLEWESATSLLALLDPGGWWNLHRIGLDGSSVNLAPVTEEIGGALWKLGSRWFTPLGDGKYAVIASGRLAVLDETTGTLSWLAPELTQWDAALAAYNGGIAGVAAGPHRESALVHVTATVTDLTAQPADMPSHEYLPVPAERVFDTPDGPVPAYVYLPSNPDFSAPDGEAPPFMIHVHGGPTGRAYPTLDLEIAYFTSRGIGVAVVNYGGSTGYGRRYRERLREQWGLVDIQDCVAVAEALVAEGLADPARLAIRGGSAGGFTSAAAMTTVRTFSAATIKYPILDLYTWTADGGETHDFESRYLDGLIGPLPETEPRYRQRSPINNADELAGPVLFLQGLEDQICPPEQADRFVASLGGRGVRHAYLTFEGEQHGFRKAETIIAALEAELSFYGQVFGFETPGVRVLDLRS
ncbi:prolyl oligopeptidase family serine peptidase [Amycolatopsis sp. NPDC059657]|uniref:prolyl oligopeptidase family serine peptidase n=1 Tax=Amycolatopsis sp. NPDC059657 TaxID=3346899 RepID=UPI00366CE4CB